MRWSRFTDEQIIGALKEHAAGLSASELCRRHGICPAPTIGKPFFQGQPSSILSVMVPKLVSQCRTIRAVFLSRYQIGSSASYYVYVQTSQDLGVHISQLRDWVKKFADDPQHAFPGQGQMKPEQLEIARLKREVIKLKAERDILKKAAAYFAKEST